MIIPNNVPSITEIVNPPSAIGRDIFGLNISVIATAIPRNGEYALIKYDRYRCCFVTV